MLTGSVYKDGVLMKNGFPAENVQDGSVIVVKTHEWGPEHIDKFDKAILLVRDPFDSLKSEFNRQYGGHTGHASPDKFRRLNWKDFVYTKGEQWEKMNIEWCNHLKGKVLVILYERLRQNIKSELRRILEFLGIDIEHKTMKCVLSRKEGSFKRSKKVIDFEIFDDKLKDFLNAKKSHLHSLLKQCRSKSKA